MFAVICTPEPPAGQKRKLGYIAEVIMLRLPSLLKAITRDIMRTIRCDTSFIWNICAGLPLLYDTCVFKNVLSSLVTTILKNTSMRFVRIIYKEEPEGSWSELFNIRSRKVNLLLKCVLSSSKIITWRCRQFLQLYTRHFTVMANRPAVDDVDERNLGTQSFPPSLNKIDRETKFKVQPGICPVLIQNRPGSRSCHRYLR